MDERIYGLLGRKLGHSWSVPIHAALGNGAYRLLELEPDGLAPFLHRKDIGGLNVTIPYKRDVMPLCDAIDPAAEAIGSVNTIVRQPDGRLVGYNTDIDGFRYMARRAGISLAGKKVVILGSGDIGLIMARRMTLEGAKVLACVEVMPYSGGLNRNIVQCLHDYDIPLYLSHTVTDIRGRDRVEQVVVSQVDEKRNPIPGTEMVFDCDTLLLSVGLIPENELTRQAGVEMDRRTNGAVVYENMETSIPGVFACGNVCHVHDLVDFVTGESQRAGAAAARYVLEGGQTSREEPVLKVKNGDGVTYTVPQRIRPGRVEKRCDLFFRVNRICGDSEIVVTSGDTQIARFKREHLAPGEMENIALPRVLLDRAKDELTVSIREVEQA